MKKNLSILLLTTLSLVAFGQNLDHLKKTSEVSPLMLKKTSQIVPKKDWSLNEVAPSAPHVANGCLSPPKLIPLHVMDLPTLFHM